MRIAPLLATLSLLAACGSTQPPCEQAFWLDADGDGYGGRNEAWIGCDPPEGYVAGPEDCGDQDPERNPEAGEVCDGIDNDCDGEIDEAPIFGPPLTFRDDDNDGYGIAEETRYGCATPGWALQAGDCDDADLYVHPGAEETCDAVDRDCDGDPVLGAVDGEPWFRDNDGDGFGRSANSTTGCGEPTGIWVLNEDDCDDTHGGIYPGAPEGLFDGVDGDCDGFELCPLDADGDGFGGADTVVADLGCTLVTAATNTLDCDDSDPAISPDADEIWYSGIDEDCDPVTRDDDLDEDGYERSLDCDDLDPLNNPGDPPAGAFTDVTAAAGIGLLQWDPAAAPSQCGGPEWMSGGAAVADYDDDGRMDLFIARMYAPDALYHQLPDGSFEEVAAAAGVDGAGSSNGALWVDVDADGDLDLVVVSAGPQAHRLYIQDGGSFTEEAALRGLGDLPAGCALAFSVSAGDADADGDLDLFVSGWRPEPAPAAEDGRLWLNDGAGSFTDGTALLGLDLATRATFSPAFVDLDGDGDQDLSVAADWGTSGLWRFDADFVEITSAAGVGTDENGMGSAWGDVDNDGDLDWFVTAVYDDALPCPAGWGCSGNRLYLHDGALGFTDGTDAAGLRDGAWGWGAAMADLDHDGDLDIAQQNGMPVPGFELDTLRIWKNDGSGVFADRACEHRAELEGQGRGVVPFDADGDGDLDLLLTFTAGSPRLLQNEGGAEAGAWLRVALSDPGGANPRGVGAIVRVTPDDGGPVRIRDVHHNSGFVATGPAEAHFGLAGASVVEVEVTWPDGAVQVESAVAVDQVLTVVRTVP